MTDGHFDHGDRVTMQAWAAAEHPKIAGRLGTVVGYTYDGMLKVVHDGNKSYETWDESVWELAATPPG